MQIIAEFCQNHNGRFDILKRMIWEAAEGGATHGKIQTIFADDLSFRPLFEEGEIDDTGTVITIKRPYQPEYQRLKGLELSYQQHEDFMKECERACLIPLTTAFNITSIPHLHDLGFKVIKVASYDCGSMPLIKSLCNNFDELIVSTGATYDADIEATASFISSKGKPFSLLHCVTIYPTPLEQMHLRRMEFLRKYAQNVGLSEHTAVAEHGVKASLAAIYLGASAIERHFTVLPESETRDGRVSIRKEHIKAMIEFASHPKEEQEEILKREVPEFQKMLGEETRELSREELLNRAYYRGRFCNHVGDKQVYNWEESAMEAT
jgi:N,N'-diacetyllegionaminate synthase